MSVFFPPADFGIKVGLAHNNKLIHLTIIPNMTGYVEELNLQYTEVSNRAVLNGVIGLNQVVLPSLLCGGAMPKMEIPNQSFTTN